MPGKVKILDEHQASSEHSKSPKSKSKSKEEVEEASDLSEEEARLARKAARKAARLALKSTSADMEEDLSDKIEKKQKKKRDRDCDGGKHDQENLEDALKKSKGSNGEAIPKGLTTKQYRTLHDIRVTGTCPDPFQSFESAGFNNELLKSVKAAGFSAPSAIQSQCWPVAMQGGDLIAVAKTGSGKTAGYLFPAFMLIRKSFPLVCKRGDGPIAVVLAPTRELAMQIDNECSKFGKPSGISSVCIFGGMPKGPQIRQLSQGLHVLIATPGRMNDFLKMDKPPLLPLGRLKYFVLDEADRMLDMGFEPQIKTIIEHFPKDSKYQSIMFTATWPKEVKNLAAKYLKSPIQINIGASGEQLTANKDVEQVLFRVNKEGKDDKLVEVLNSIKDRDSASVIVFANQKFRCDYIVKGLKDAGWPAVSIHGDKEQWERQRALERFTKGQVKVIVATDVAARGLDIKGVSHVINYDFPMNGTEDWVHRVGRTGRAGAKGTAVTFFDVYADKRSARELCGVLRGVSQPVPDWLQALVSASKPGGAGGSRWSSWGRGGQQGWRGGRGGGGRGGGGQGGGGDKRRRR